MVKILKYFFKTIILISILWLLLFGLIYATSLIDQKRTVDAIVVLGASQWNGTPSPVLKSRLDHAYDIYKEGYSDYIILTGGIAKGEKISESMVGKNYLKQKGVPQNKILIEEKGLTTSESLKKASDIIKENNFHKILFISNGYHMLRVKKIARDLDIKYAYSSPVSTKNTWKKMKYILIIICYAFASRNTAPRICPILSTMPKIGLISMKLQYIIVSDYYGVMGTYIQLGPRRCISEMGSFPLPGGAFLCGAQYWA